MALMKKQLAVMATGLSLSVLAVSAAPMAALAHHSFAMFDMNKTVTLVGSVVAFRWTNPHASIELMVPGANGQPERWAVEMNSPNNLVREGWKRTSMKPGDKVTVVLRPLRDGKHGGLYQQATLADGTVLKEPDKKR